MIGMLGRDWLRATDELDKGIVVVRENPGLLRVVLRVLHAPRQVQRVVSARKGHDIIRQLLERAAEGFFLVYVRVLVGLCDGAETFHGQVVVVEVRGRNVLSKDPGSIVRDGLASAQRMLHCLQYRIGRYIRTVVLSVFVLVHPCVSLYDIP